MYPLDSSSPHIRYLGGPFGRVSLLGSGVTFAPHARDCMQILINLDARPLIVHLDGRPLYIAQHHATVIHPRQIYAIAGQDRAGEPPRTPSSMLIKMPSELPASLPIRNTAIALDTHERERIAGLLADMMRRYPDSPYVESELSHLSDSILGLTSNGTVVAHVDAKEGDMDRRVRQCADALVFDEIATFRPVRCSAEELDVSERHFFALFRRATGLPPRFFYNMRRLEIAFALLLDTSHSVADISYELGFSAPAHFTRFLRANTGWTPSAYRQAVSTMPNPLRLTVQHTVPFEPKSGIRLRRLQ